MRPSDPRIRQTLNQVSQTLETINLNSQASLFTFSESYISPCFSSLSNCFEASCPTCFPSHRREDALRRRNRGRMGRNTQRGRPELSFDFYDDWNDEEEGAGLLEGWGNDELDRLLAGSGGGRQGIGEQPGRHAGMNYGSRGGLRKKGGLSKDEDGDAIIVPNSSMFGFLERLPWKIAGRGVRYQPSAADLQDNVGRKAREEGQVLLEESESEDTTRKKHQRKRSGTNTSRSTTNSLSSRGDLFPSEDEDDAIPLDDEFAIVLERQTTGHRADDASSGRTRGKRPSASSASRTSTKTASSKETRATRMQGQGDATSGAKVPEVTEATEMNLPSMDELKREEVQVRVEDEAAVEHKRQSAQKLARERGLSIEGEEPEVVVRNPCLSSSNYDIKLKIYLDVTQSPEHTKSVTSSEPPEVPAHLQTSDLATVPPASPPAPADEKPPEPSLAQKDAPSNPHARDRPPHDFADAGP